MTISVAVASLTSDPAFAEGVLWTFREYLSSSDDLQRTGSGFAELWSLTGRPLFAPLMAFLVREGEWMMMIGFSACWLWSIAAMLRTGSAEAKSAGFNHVCLISYIGGLAYLIQRLGPGWSGEVIFWLYMLNIVLTMIDLKLIMEYRLNAKVAPVSAALKRQHVGGVPGDADIAPLLQPADHADIGAVYRSEDRAPGREDELNQRILALEGYVAQLRRERDVAVDAVSETNLFRPDDKVHITVGEAVETQPRSEIVIRNLARRSIHARAWEEIRAADEVGHKGVGGSLI